MARDDLLDFGNPTDPQKRGLDGQFIGGPKPGGLWDVPDGEGLFDAPRPKKLVGVERLGSGLDTPKRSALKGVETWGKPMGHKQAEARRRPGRKVESGPQGRMALVLALIALAVAGWLTVQRVDSGAATDTVPVAPGSTTTRVIPGSEGRFVMPVNQG